MEKKQTTTYLMVPLALTLFLAANKAAADEKQSSAPPTTVINSEGTSAAAQVSSAAATSETTSFSSETATSASSQVSAPSTKTGASEVKTEAETSLTTTESENAMVVSRQTEAVTDSAKTTRTEQSQDSTISTWAVTRAKTESSQAQSDSVAPVRARRSLTKAVALTASHQVKKSTLTAKQASNKEITTASVDEKGIKLQYNRSIAANTKIQFAVWSARNGQNDLQWYTANNMGAAYAEFKNHRDYGIYYIHTYANQKGKMIGLNAKTVRVASPQVKTSIQKKSTGHFDITVTNVPKTITRISVPVWSDKKGQDDLKWYSATKVKEGTYKVSVNTRNHHNDLGHYQAHIYGYSTVTQSQIGLAVSSGFDNVDSRSNASASVENYKEKSTTFDVVIKGSAKTKTIKAVSVAVWSEQNGQDDLKWYTPAVSNNQARVKIDIANHGNVSGKYHVHVYIDYKDNTRSGQVLGPYKITKPIVKASLTSTGISLKLNTNTIKDKSKVSFAVWSDSKGQDDLQWYQANQKGEALASYNKHQGYGVYHIHTYQNQNGRMVGLEATSLTIAKPSLSAKVSKVADNEYTVTLTNVPYYITSLKVPVWTEKNKQDDIQWYQAQKISDKTYRATILLKNHHFEKGRYNVHVYGNSQLEKNKLLGLATTSFNVSSVKIGNPSVKVSNHKVKEGTLDVVVTETKDSKRLKSIKVAAWSEAKQKNLQWYSSSHIKDGKVTITVNEKNHGYIKGNYNVHVYVTYQDGQEVGFNKGTYRLEAEKPAMALPSYFIDISSHNGTISVSEFNRLKQAGIRGVVVKLTEGTSYTNPYAAAQIANARAAGIKVSAYHYAHYRSVAEAQAEARYFVNAAKAHGLSTSTVMVNDMEESAMLVNINANVQAWQSEMKRQGYNNLVHYTMASWLDIRGGQVNTSALGLGNFWIAHYAKGYTYMTQEEAKSFNYYANAAAWQYTSVSPKLGNPLDESIDYTGRFTQA